MNIMMMSLWQVLDMLVLRALLIFQALFVLQVALSLSYCNPI